MPQFVAKIPKAPSSIQKGSSLGKILDKPALKCLSENISYVHKEFSAEDFCKEALKGISSLGLLDRGHHIARVLREHLPQKYSDATAILIDSLTPPLEKTTDMGLAVFFYLPHICFVSNFGLDPKHNGGKDPFAASMKAQYEFTRRFSAEFSIRPFIIKWQERTLAQLMKWTDDKDPHVRRLCSEGSRPRLPWASQIPAFIEDPSPALPILEKLKDDESLYVRRSVANHLGDIAKDHLTLALDTCEAWLEGASKDRKWAIRHALRYPAKKGNKRALSLRKKAK